MPGSEVVWLSEPRHYAVLIQRGAYVSLVSFVRDGQTFEVYVENDEYEFLEDILITYEHDD